MFGGFRVWPNQVWAARKLGPPEGHEWKDRHGPLNAAETEACEARIAAVVEEVQRTTDFPAEAIAQRWCQMVAQPLWNVEAIGEGAKRPSAMRCPVNPE